MSSASRRPWTRDELILAINLYCRTPFGRIHIRNPEIVELSSMLGRTPGAVSYKLANFASIDPTLDRKGAANSSRLDREVWSEFFEDWDSMILESEARMNQLKRPEAPIGVDDLLPDVQGGTRAAIVKVRTNQEIFRRMILTSYNHTCCITGIDHAELLVAGHIVPWSCDEKNRLNPMNGLCLNALHDRAFDMGLISIDRKYRVMVSRRVKHHLIRQYRGEPIMLPRRFLPDQRFLEYHRTTIFNRA